MRTDLGRPLRAATTSENARSSLGRAGDFQPTPIKSTGVGDRRDYRSGDQPSLPESTDRHGPRRYAGEPARFRRSLRRRQRKFDHTAKCRDYRDTCPGRVKNYFY